MIRDRIARVKYERTQTVMEPRDETAGKGFSSFQDDEELKGLTEDEKMKQIAAKMEEKFKSEQRRKSSMQVVRVCDVPYTRKILIFFKIYTFHMRSKRSSIWGTKQNISISWELERAAIGSIDQWF